MLHLRELLPEHITHAGGQVRFERFLICGHRRILPALAFLQNRVIVAARHRRFEIDPPPMHRPHHRTRCGRCVIAKILGQHLQLRRKLSALRRESRQDPL